MTSFDGTTFIELGSDSSYAVWSKSGSTLIKNIPGGSKNVIQKVGTDLPRLALPVLLTAAQLASLKTKAESATVGTLIFSYETCSARLQSVDSPASISIDNDLYPAILNLIRTGSVSTTPSTAILTEASEPFITESSEYLIQG